MGRLHEAERLAIGRSRTGKIPLYPLALTPSDGR